MTTNFDFVRECPTTGERSAIHLGLSGGGWRFQFRAHPALGLMSLKDWIAFMKRDYGVIHDEYNRPRTLDEFLSFVQSKQSERAQRAHERSPDRYPAGPEERMWVDPEGYTFANYEFS